MCLKDQSNGQEMVPEPLMESLDDILGMDVFNDLLASNPIVHEVIKEMSEFQDSIIPGSSSMDSDFDVNFFDRFDIFNNDDGVMSEPEDMMPSVSDTDDFARQHELMVEQQRLASYQNAFIDDRYTTAPPSPDLFVLVNPRTGVPIGVSLDEDDKEELTEEFKKNNGIDSEEESSSSDASGYHFDHCYSRMPEWEVERRKALEEIKIEPVVPVKRPVGRPRKAATQQKRSAAHFDQEEIVDVESIQVKRARKTPSRPRPAPRAAPKRRGRKPASVETSENSSSPTHYEPVPSCSYATDSCGYVMRQAKTTALKKIAKTKKSPVVSRSKRNDHNDMERRRRHEMKNLFDGLKVKVPGHLLVDANGKMKKNPSKNTVLNGAYQHLFNIQEERAFRHTLLQRRNTLLYKMEKLRKKMKKLKTRKYW